MEQPNQYREKMMCATAIPRAAEFYTRATQLKRCFKIMNLCSDPCVWVK